MTAVAPSKKAMSTMKGILFVLILVLLLVLLLVSPSQILRMISMQVNWRNLFQQDLVKWQMLSLNRIIH